MQSHLLLLGEIQLFQLEYARLGVLHEVEKFPHCQVGHMNFSCWPTNSCLVWNLIALYIATLFTLNNGFACRISLMWIMQILFIFTSNQLIVWNETVKIMILPCVLYYCLLSMFIKLSFWFVLVCMYISFKVMEK